MLTKERRRELNDLAREEERERRRGSRPKPKTERRSTVVEDVMMRGDELGWRGHEVFKGYGEGMAARLMNSRDKRKRVLGEYLLRASLEYDKAKRQQQGSRGAASKMRRIES